MRSWGLDSLWTLLLLGASVPALHYRLFSWSGMWSWGLGHLWTLLLLGASVPAMYCRLSSWSADPTAPRGFPEPTDQRVEDTGVLWGLPL